MDEAKRKERKLPFDGAAELTEEALNGVTGGVYNPNKVKDRSKPCKREGCTNRTTDPTGFCASCLKELKKQGFTPIV